MVGGGAEVNTLRSGQVKGRAVVREKLLPW